MEPFRHIFVLFLLSRAECVGVRRMQVVLQISVLDLRVHNDYKEIHVRRETRLGFM